MSRIDDFCTLVGRDLADHLGDGYEHGVRRVENIYKQTEFGFQGFILRPSVKGLPLSHVKLVFGVRHFALDELREKLGLRPTLAFHVHNDSDASGWLRGSPGSRGFRRNRNRFDCGPWLCNLDTDGPGFVERMKPVVAEIALPYFAHFSDLRNIRRSIDRNDAWCPGLQEVELVMLIDAHLQDSKHLKRFRSGRNEVDQRRYDQLLPQVEAMF